MNISWEAPFSLRDDPITYCFVMVDSSNIVIFSQCGIVNTLLTIPSLPPEDIACKTYEITVTPVNTQGNGTATSIHINFKASGWSVLMIKVFLCPACPCEFPPFILFIEQNGSLQVNRVYYSNGDEMKITFQMQTVASCQLKMQF